MTQLKADLTDRLTRIANTERLLVALDFDGTLAPLVDDPAESRALPGANDAVRRLIALPETRVAFISGRAAASLLQVSDAPTEALIVGSHGAETRIDGPDIRIDLDDDDRERVRVLGQVLNDVAAPLPGIWLEPKPAGFALHTRLASEVDAALAVEQALERTQAAFPGLTVRRGKDVLEFSVRHADKGQALALLRERTGATGVFFAGDDVTDEDGFRALSPGDLGLKVGPGETLADARVADPEAVAEVLHALADLRSGNLSSVIA